VSLGDETGPDPYFRSFLIPIGRTFSSHNIRLVLNRSFPSPKMAPPRGVFAVYKLLFLAAVIGFFSSLVNAAASTKATVLIIARDIDAARSAHSGLQGYGIPYRVLVVPMSGATLPLLNSSITVGNYGGIVVLGDVSYDYGGGAFRSALTDAQWQQMYDYQKNFHIRMVRMDVYPGPQFGKRRQLQAADKSSDFSRCDNSCRANRLL
jgi:hypothetical protein